jgi:DNA-binding MarR family transcriptional regulator
LLIKERVLAREIQILFRLADQPFITPKQLSQTSDISRALAHYFLKKLLKKGYAYRYQKGIYVITEKGRRQAEKLRERLLK